MNGLQKFYIGLWVVFGLTIAGLAVTGNLTMLAVTVLGCMSFGLIFMGMMCVLPTTVTHPGEPLERSRLTEGARTTMRRFVNAWAHPTGVELRQPKVH